VESDEFEPSASLIRAVLLAGAEDMTGLSVRCVCAVCEVHAQLNYNNMSSNRVLCKRLVLRICLGRL
jgi:hypothetical protein